MATSATGVGGSTSGVPGSTPSSARMICSSNAGTSGSAATAARWPSRGSRSVRPLSAPSAVTTEILSARVDARPGSDRDRRGQADPRSRPRPCRPAGCCGSGCRRASPSSVWAFTRAVSRKSPEIGARSVASRPTITTGAPEASTSPAAVGSTNTFHSAVGGLASSRGTLPATSSAPPIITIDSTISGQAGIGPEGVGGVRERAEGEERHAARLQHLRQQLDGRALDGGRGDLREAPHPSRRRRRRATRWGTRDPRPAASIAHRPRGRRRRR